MRLAHYHQEKECPRALEAYAEFVRQEKPQWSLSYKLKIYGKAKTAFLSKDPTKAFAAFEGVHSDLVNYWGIYRTRNANGGMGWDARRVYDILSTRCSSSSRSQMSLKTVGPEHDNILKNCLLALKDVKPNQQYPFMPVSKLLHFFNPKLFPIFDTEVMWNQVFGPGTPFYEDYGDACLRFGTKRSESTWKFNWMYTRWAGEIMQQAAPGLMDRFAEWFRAEVAGREDPVGVLKDAGQYCAVAFEYIAIGATRLERKAHAAR